jgi:hypothetical protein
MYRADMVILGLRVHQDSMVLELKVIRVHLDLQDLQDASLELAVDLTQMRLEVWFRVCQRS